MNKSDLKDGMVVELRKGKRFLIVKNLMIGNTWYELSWYNDDLIDCSNRDFDIVKIWGINDGFSITAILDPNKECGIELLWERNEVDWSKVPKDTKVLVSNGEGDDVDFKDSFVRRYFAKYENGMCYTYAQGTDSWTSEGYCYKLVSWKYCKLAEEPKVEVSEEFQIGQITEEKHEYCMKNNKESGVGDCSKCEYNMLDDCTITYIVKNYNVTRKDK